jgi:hypothetical protein
MNFSDYYSTLKKTPLVFRDQACKKLEISPETFYLKKKNNSWDPGQKLILAQLTGIPEEELFPKSAKNNSNV